MKYERLLLLFQDSKSLTIVSNLIYYRLHMATYAEFQPGIHKVSPERSDYLEHSLWAGDIQNRTRGFEEADRVYLDMLKASGVVKVLGYGGMRMPEAVAEQRFNAFTRAAFGVRADDVTEVPEELRGLFAEQGRDMHFVRASYEDNTKLERSYKRIDLTLPDGTKRIGLVLVRSNGELYGDTFRQGEPNGPWVNNGGNHDMLLGEFVHIITR